MTISVKQSNTYAAATGVWVKVNGVWKQVATSGLDGLGSWALLKRATGSPKRHQYTASGTAWVAYEWTAPTGSLTTTEGMLDVFLISGGGGGSTSRSGNGGDVLRGLHEITDGQHAVVCGRGAEGNYRGKPSSVGPLTTGMASTAPGVTECTGAGATDADITAGLLTKILGEPGLIYGKGHTNAVVSQTNGNGGAPNHSGASGSCLVRVPTVCDNIPSSDWVTRIDYYAEVTDGIVTDTYQERFYGDDTVRTENGQYASPEQPDDLIPCDPSVAEGWTYQDGEFTPPPPPPPPTREELIEALQEQIKDLQKDT